MTLNQIMSTEWAASSANYGRRMQYLSNCEYHFDSLEQYLSEYEYHIFL